MSDPLRDAERRIQRAWSVDGLADIAVGLLLLCPAALEWAKTGLDRRSGGWQTLNFAQMLVILLGPWAAMWGLPRLRNRLFPERSGVQIPRMVPPKGAIRGAAVAVVAAMTAAVLVIMRTGFYWVPLMTLVTGFASALILVRTGQSGGVPRYPAMGAAIAVASVLIALRGGDFETAFMLQFGFMGALATVTGVVVLLQWLRTAKPQERTAA